MTENVYEQDIFKRIGMRHPGGEKSTGRLAELAEQFSKENGADFENAKEILNICCGDGSGMELFYERGFSVTGLDCSQKMLRKAKENYPHMRWILQNADDLSVLEKKYAFVLSECSLSEAENLRKRLLQIQNILVPGGIFLAADVVSADEMQKKQWEDTFAGAGFFLLYQESHPEWVKEFLARFLWEASPEEEKLLCGNWKKWKRAEYVLSVYRRC